MRPSKDNYFISMAQLVATRSTCLRRAVGCVLTNNRGHVLATGYNGVPAGLPHCNEPVQYSTPTPKGEEQRVFFPHACTGSNKPSGQGLDSCCAVHAEQNALLQCSDVYAIDTCYTTTQPCITCTKLLLNTSCRRIVYLDDYSHREAAELWAVAGREMVRRVRTHDHNS